MTQVQFSTAAGGPFLNSKFPLYVVALILATGWVTLAVGGTLILSEVLFLFLALGIIVVRWRDYSKIPHALKLIMALIAGGAIYAVADVLNHSLTTDLLKGALRWVFLAGAAISLGYVFSRYRLAPVFAVVGLTVSGVVSAWQYAQVEGWGWKFCIAEPLTMLVILLGTRLPKLIGACFYLALAVVNFYLDYRSMGGFCLVCSGFLILRATNTRSKRLLIVGIVTALMVGAGYFAYRAAILKSEDRSARSDDSNEIRLTGMSFGWEVIKISPWKGHGTWATTGDLLAMYIQMMQDARLERGAAVNGVGSENQALVGAIHSQILQAGAEAGVFASLVFVFFAYLILKGFYRGYVGLERMTNSEVICVFFMISALWAIIFSPFAGNNRMGLALGLASALRLITMTEQKKNTSKSRRV